jgi:hypothetical protein
MAQTGYTPILIYSSSTTTNAPAVGNLTNSTLGSELAINITDGKLFYKDNANAIQVIGWKVVPATAGGTGQTSYAVGDILYANTTTSLAKLADVATGNALISGGVGVAPSWGKIGLTTHVSGTLGVTNGGTGTATAFTAGSVVFAGASGVYSQDNANLFFDDTNNRLGVATNTPASVFEVQATATGTTPNAVKTYTSYIQNGAVGTNAGELAGWGVRYGTINSTPIWFGAKFLKNGINAASDFTVWTSLDGDVINLVERLNVAAAGDVTVKTGNLVIGTSGKGIDFAAAGGDILAQYDEFTAASTACQNAITTACVWKLTKIGNQVTITLPKVTGTAGGSNVNFVLGANIPSAYRPSADIGFYGATVINNGAVVTAPGWILITTGGNIIVYRDASGVTAWTNGATAGLNEALGISWTI